MPEEQTAEETPASEEGMEEAHVDVETGRPRSSSVIGGLRSPLDDKASKRAGVLEPGTLEENEERTGSKLSQWGASSRRRSYWKSLYY